MPCSPGVVAMGCTLAPWDTVGRAVSQRQLQEAFDRDAEERRVYGSLAWRLRASPTLWAGPQAPPFLVLVAESEHYMPSILEEGARFVRLLRERGRSADLRILRRPSPCHDDHGLCGSGRHGREPGHRLCAESYGCDRNALTGSCNRWRRPDHE